MKKLLIIVSMYVCITHAMDPDLERGLSSALYPQMENSAYPYLPQSPEHSGFSDPSVPSQAVMHSPQSQPPTPQLVLLYMPQAFVEREENNRVMRPPLMTQGSGTYYCVLAAFVLGLIVEHGLYVWAGGCDQS